MLILLSWRGLTADPLMMIKRSISEGIRGAIPDKKENDESMSAKDYIKSVEDQFKGSLKVYASTLIHRLINNMYDGSGSIRDHIMRKCNMAAKLKTMGLTDGFFGYASFILTSLPLIMLLSPLIITL